MREARLRVKSELLDERDKRALELAAKYADGWRPKDELSADDDDDDDDQDERGDAQNLDESAGAVPSESERDSAGDTEEPEPESARS